MEKYYEEIYSVHDEVYDLINELNVDGVIKNELLRLNDKLQEIKDKYNSKIDILIDCMATQDIKSILEYTVIMLSKYQITKGKIYDYSKVDNINSIEEDSIVVIDDFEEFEDNVIACSKYRINKFFNTIKTKKSMLVMTCPDKIENYYNDDFSIQQFNPDLCIHIKGKADTPEQIYDRLIKEYSRNKIDYELDKRKMCNVINNIIGRKICSSYLCYSYLYDYSLKRKIIENQDKITIDLFNKLVKCEKNDDNNLDKLIGLKSVKEEIETLKNYLSFKNKTNKKINKMYLNMFFMGNPGTGKTTVARMLASYLYDLGYINENKVVEIIPNDLMANYVGQTKDQIRKILKKAEGGILFIDEAYMIANVVYSDGFASYMKEAVSELLKYLENPKNVVIFAGYKNEMKKIYNTNPGIKSRIFKEIDFPDYSVNELFSILKNNLSEIGLTVSKSAKDNIVNYIKNEKSKPNFGNARAMEQFAQILVTNHANRKLKQEDFIISEKDVPIVTLENKSFGFIGG